MNRILQPVKVINLNNYRPIGIIGTVKFEEGVLPVVGDIINYEGATYRITGIVVSSNSELLNNNMDQNIYDCKLEVITGID